MQQNLFACTEWHFDFFALMSVMWKIFYCTYFGETLCLNALSTYRRKKYVIIRMCRHTYGNYERIMPRCLSNDDLARKDISGTSVSALVCRDISLRTKVMKTNDDKDMIGPKCSTFERCASHRVVVAAHERCYRVPNKAVVGRIEMCER